VPRVVGKTLGAARARLALQPLSSKVIYKPAEPLQRVDLVVDQFPRRGTLSSRDSVTLVMARPLGGLVPRVEGTTVERARALLEERGLQVQVVRLAKGPPGLVVSQRPRAGVAAAKGMTVSLVVGGAPAAHTAASRTAG
jgi:beta-lactam-binding protein with PASTA domain